MLSFITTNHHLAILIRRSSITRLWPRLAFYQATTYRKEHMQISVAPIRPSDLTLLHERGFPGPEDQQLQAGVKRKDEHLNLLNKTTMCI